jgi:hypothetical protein
MFAKLRKSRRCSHSDTMHKKKETEKLNIRENSKFPLTDLLDTKMVSKRNCRSGTFVFSFARHKNSTKFHNFNYNGKGYSFQS